MEGQLDRNHDANTDPDSRDANTDTSHDANTYRHGHANSYRNGLSTTYRNCLTHYCPYADPNRKSSARSAGP